MKISAIAAAFLIAASMFVGGQAMAGASGKVTGIEREGRVIHIGKSKVSISGSRTKVTIKGKEADRGEIKKGMMCTADVDSGRAKMVSCK
jgi:hypothetical protein